MGRGTSPGEDAGSGRWRWPPAGSGFRPEPAGAARRLCVVMGRQLGSRALARGPKSRPAAAEALPVPKRQTTAEPTVSGRPRRVVLGFRVPSAAPPSLGGMSAQWGRSARPSQGWGWARQTSTPVRRALAVTPRSEPRPAARCRHVRRCVLIYSHTCAGEWRWPGVRPVPGLRPCCPLGGWCPLGLRRGVLLKSSFLKAGHIALIWTQMTKMELRFGDVLLPLHLRNNHRDLGICYF